MADTSEKQWERRACAALGAKRMGNRGVATSDDDGTSPFAIEAFMGATPKLPARKMAQAARWAKESGRPWVIAQQVRGRPLALATCLFQVFVSLVWTAQRSVALAETYGTSELAERLSADGYDELARALLELRTSLDDVRAQGVEL